MEGSAPGARVILRLPLALVYAALALGLGSAAMLAVVARVFVSTLRQREASFTGALAGAMRRGR